MENIEQLDEKSLEVFKVLKDWVKEHKKDKKPVTYKELAELVNNQSIIPTNLGMYLGRVSTYCMAKNAPAISSIVVGSEKADIEGIYGSNVPGRGFFELINRIPKNQDEVFEIWLPIYNSVFEYENWENV